MTTDCFLIYGFCMFRKHEIVFVVTFTHMKNHNTQLNERISKRYISAFAWWTCLKLSHVLFRAFFVSIFRSSLGLQLLQNTKINKQTVTML